MSRTSCDMMYDAIEWLKNCDANTIIDIFHLDEDEGEETMNALADAYEEHMTKLYDEEV